MLEKKKPYTERLDEKNDSTDGMLETPREQSVAGVALQRRDLGGTGGSGRQNWWQAL